MHVRSSLDLVSLYSLSCSHSQLQDQDFTHVRRVLLELPFCLLIDNDFIHMHCLLLSGAMLQHYCIANSPLGTPTWCIATIGVEKCKGDVQQ